MRALFATLVVTAIAALVGVSSATAAPPNFNAAANLCTAQGGTFNASPDEYICFKSGGFSDSQFTPARTLCNQAYGGFFFTDSEFGFDFEFCLLNE